ncbi:MAG: homoserine dehydrogenase [Candidatus Hadarchaeia archaeon]
MKLTFVGFGNLGKGLARVLLEKEDYLKNRSGFSPEVVAVVDIDGAVIDPDGIDLQELLERAEDGGKITDYPDANEEVSALDVIEDVNSDVVVELTPTSIEDGEPGLSHIKKAMDLQKHVVTSNKGPLVVAFRELEDKAYESGIEFRYSATVGGAVPVIGLARNQLSGDSVSEIRGVLNGTTNYILTRMAEEGVPFDVVLHEAQELGIAEKDPTLDIEGIDTAAKMTILTNSLLDRDVKLDDVEIEGITRIGPELMELAKETGKEIRLVGVASSQELEVSPKLVSEGDPLAVRGTLNSVTLKTDLAREVTITGFGAGPRETSSALLGDIVDIYKTVSGF